MKAHISLKDINGQALRSHVEGSGWDFEIEFRCSEAKFREGSLVVLDPEGYLLFQAPEELIHSVRIAPD